MLGTKYYFLYFFMFIIIDYSFFVKIKKSYHDCTISFKKII